MERLLELIKEYQPLLIALNLFLTFLLFVFPSDSGITIYSPSDKTSSNSSIKLHICKSAFEGIKNKKISEYFIHPDVIKNISEEDAYIFAADSKIYSKMAASELCNVVVRTDKGFKAFQAVIREDGPLHFRATSITFKKPEYHEIKEYL